MAIGDPARLSASSLDQLGAGLAIYCPIDRIHYGGRLRAVNGGGIGRIFCRRSQHNWEFGGPAWMFDPHTADRTARLFHQKIKVRGGD